MEAAVQTMVKVFLSSTKGKESLGKKEFQRLVKTQLSNILSDTDSTEAINKMAQELDADQDGKVGFEEYMRLVGYLAVSLSEQRTPNEEEPAQTAASTQVAQSAPGNDVTPGAAEAKPEASAEAKAEATAEVKVEAGAEPKVEIGGANAEPKGELKLAANGDAKVEVKAEEATEPKAEAEEEKPAAALATAVEGAASSVEGVVNEEKVEVTDKVEEAAEKLAVAAEEEVEKKIEEATS